MNTRIDWVMSRCRLLADIRQEFAATLPFAGLTIGTGIHLEPKTVALLVTLQAGGARVVATGNLNSTQQSAIDYLAERGVEVIGGPTRDEVQHAADIAGVLATHPHILLDNGGDLFMGYLHRPYAGLIGGTEETTSGRARLLPHRDELAVPVLVINDSPIKQFAENKHAVGQSVLESFMRMTNVSTGGKRVVVFGYGACGAGVALNFRNAHALVTVIETDPVRRLEALLDGFTVCDRDEALANADAVMTVTGARDVVGPEDLPLLRDGVVLANAGHFPVELQVDALRRDGAVESIQSYGTGIETLVLRDGRRISLLGEGHMVNLAGPGALGNSIESMDIGFALQARCLQAVAGGQVDAEHCVVPVPRSVDEMVANHYVSLATGAAPVSGRAEPFAVAQA